MSKLSLLAVALIALAAQTAAKPADLIRVACVGDSITYGVNLGANQSYPLVLVASLGSGYWVQNFGSPGLSLMKISPQPASHPAYVDTTQYQAALNSCPNIVIIMLGTYDASFAPAAGQTWSQTYNANYISQYEAMIGTFRALPSHPEVFVCSTPYCYGSNQYGIDPAIVNTVLVPDAHQIASDTQSPLIDMDSATSGIGSDFADNVHPNADGAARLANAAYTALKSFKITRAQYLKTDDTTKGSWKGVYGGQGFCTSQDSSANNPSIPGNVTWTITGQGNQQWAVISTDPRALQQTAKDSTARTAGAWTSSNAANSSFDINLNFTDGSSHQVSLYALDWDTSNARSETVQVIEVPTGRILDTRNITSFTAGKYLVWNVTGNLKFHVVNTTGGAVMSGIFIDSIKVPLGQVISLQSKSNGLYVTADNAGASPLIANRKTAGTWEQFQVVDSSQGAGNSVISLKSLANNDFVSADIDKSKPPQLIAERAAVGGAWECYIWTPQSDGTVGLQSVSNNMYITSNPQPLPLVASKPSIGGAWEVFNWQTY